MGNFEEVTYDMRVRTITKVERDKEIGSTTEYRLVARDKEGINEIVISSASPFKGLTAKTGVIQVTLGNSQKTIDDFKKEEKEEGE